MAQNGTNKRRKTSESLVHALSNLTLCQVAWRSRELYNNEENATKCHKFENLTLR